MPTRRDKRRRSPVAPDSQPPKRGRGRPRLAPREGATGTAPLASIGVVASGDEVVRRDISGAAR